MSARVLTNDEYTQLTGKLLERDPLPSEVAQMKQVHRLLASGHKPEDLTPTEQQYAGAFNGARLAWINNDFGGEPGVEVEDEPDVKHARPAKDATPATAPKKNGK